MARTIARFALAAGAVGSVVLLFRARQHPPPFLLFLFVLWVLGPFATLALAHFVSPRWSALTQATLHGLTIAVSAASLAIYGGIIVVAPAGSANAFTFVVVAPVSFVVIVMVLAAAGFVSGRRARSADR